MAWASDSLRLRRHAGPMGNDGIICPSPVFAIVMAHLTGTQKRGWKGGRGIEKALLGRMGCKIEEDRGCKRPASLLVCKLEGLEPHPVKAENAEGILDVFGLRC